VCDEFTGGGRSIREPHHDREDALSTITPHLWFDTQAREAAEFYCKLYPDSGVTTVTRLHDTPSGDCDLVAFRVSAGRRWRSAPARCL
jgi:hypothetical protein